MVWRPLLLKMDRDQETNGQLLNQVSWRRICILWMMINVKTKPTASKLVAFKLDT